jgi:CRISPR-associated protein Csd2
MQITKSVNGEPGEKKSSDTMGMKHFVRFGLYVLKGSVNVQLAEKTGFSQEDAEVLKECLRTLFVNDASSARPEGSMEVVKLFWWQHNCKDGQYSSAKVHRSIHVTPRVLDRLPASVEDYEITVDELPGLTPEIIDGV